MTDSTPLRLALADCRRLLSVRGEANGPLLAQAIVQRIEALDETQRARFFDPQGREVHACPGRPRPPDLGWSAIATANTQLAITADTNVCRWDGDPVDYGHIIDGLVRLDALH